MKKPKTRAKKPFADITSSAANKERSFDWYMRAVQKLAGNITNASSTLTSDIGKLQNSLEANGGMYMFLYDASTKDRLAYWDKFPLCIPISNAPGGFIGLNLHYLPPMYRAQLFSKLLEGSKDDRFDSAQWNIIKNFPGIQVCAKRYLIANVKSRILKVDPQHWKASIFLPVHEFEGATAREVWNDSKENM